MKNQDILTKTKIINRIMINGQKSTSEKILFKSFKKLQKNTKKQVKKIFKLCLINSMPIFKLQISENKKIRKKKRKPIVKPVFLLNPKTRISLSIKFILDSLKKKSNVNYDLKLSKEILLSAENKGNSKNTVKEINKQVIQNKKYFNKYRW
jgi:small subunit ribosomal protein S7